MGKSLRELVKELMGSRDGVLPSIQTFPPLDLEQIARELRIEERATEAGQRNWPPVESELEDVAELDIRAEIERRARKATEDYRQQVELYEARVRRALISTDQRIKIEAAGEGALTDFKVQVTDERNHLHLVRQELKGREHEFEAFRDAHRLNRLPNRVSHNRRNYGRALIVLFVVFESILNGIFFAKGSESGLIGGVVQALGFSALNVGAAVLYATYGAGQLVHRQWVHKIVGLLATVAYILWALTLNLLIAHFRDLFILSEGQVDLGIMLENLSSAPLRLADANSWLLALLGMGLSVATLIDVLGLDEKYPSYGAIGRRREKATHDYADAKSDCLRGLQNTRDEAVTEMQAVIDAMRAAEYEVRLAVEGRSNLHRNYQAYLLHAADAYMRLSRQFREANLRARNAADVPARFHRATNPPEFISTGPIPDMPELARDERSLVMERMEYFIKSVNRQYEEAANSFDTVVEVTNLARGNYGAT